ncbi:hypothetical protein GCM10007933_27300 [Zoogloea oryzae]|uniref:Uncharacterized protein n=1 Tax=Zoogloea oryzae TaxID=310767 RepID=A0ABQ6FFB3_9RHOO|nr:hypothetical protein GCM10007933_27300 [Zoogloea oryzae]
MAVALPQDGGGTGMDGIDDEAATIDPMPRTGQEDIAGAHLAGIEAQLGNFHPGGSQLGEQVLGLLAGTHAHMASRTGVTP